MPCISLFLVPELRQPLVYTDMRLRCLVQRDARLPQATAAQIRPSNSSMLAVKINYKYHPTFSFLKLPQKKIYRAIDYVRDKGPEIGGAVGGAFAVGQRSEMIRIAVLAADREQGPRLRSNFQRGRANGAVGKAGCAPGLVV